MASDEKDPLTSARGDFYHQGVITKLFPSNNTGVVRTESGRELTFSYELVILCGEAKSPLELKVGEPVGYDLGWTSNGLRITKVKTYPKARDDSLS
jgi:hypothetical protein